MIRRAWRAFARGLLAEANGWHAGAAIIADVQAPAPGNPRVPAPTPVPGQQEAPVPAHGRPPRPAPAPARDPGNNGYGRWLKSIDVFENATIVTDWDAETHEVFPASFDPDR